MQHWWPLRAISALAPYSVSICTFVPATAPVFVLLWALVCHQYTLAPYSATSLVMARWSLQSNIFTAYWQRWKRAWLPECVFCSVSICTFVPYALCRASTSAHMAGGTCFQQRQYLYICTSKASKIPLFAHRFQELCVMKHYASLSAESLHEVLCYCTQISCHILLLHSRHSDITSAESLHEKLCYFTQIWSYCSLREILSCCYLLLHSDRYEATALCVMKHYASLSTKCLHVRLCINYLINYIYIIQI
jgi:hypothetical protein